MTPFVRHLTAAAVLTITILGCTLSEASPSVQAASLRGEARDAEFTLVIHSPQAIWSAAEEITVQAELSYTGTSQELAIGGAIGGVIAFSVEEVTGDRRMDAIRDAACARYTIGPDRPITSPYIKSGVFNPGEPNEAFYREFFDDPLFRLPTGTWRVTAWAALAIGPDCGGRQVDLRAPLLITVQ